MHMLVIPKEHVVSVKTMDAAHLGLLQHMRDAGAKQLEAAVTKLAAGFCRSFRGSIR